MMAITTRSSIKVKPPVRLGFRDNADWSRFIVVEKLSATGANWLDPHRSPMLGRSSPHRNPSNFWHPGQWIVTLNKS